MTRANPLFLLFAAAFMKTHRLITSLIMPSSVRCSHDSLRAAFGFGCAGELIFYYQYLTNFCDTAYNSLPIHLENTNFPVVERQALNLSTRGTVSSGDDT
jgi:hypothetical protein